MQRYVFSSRTGCVNEHPDGKWVLASDAQSELTRLTAERDQALTQVAAAYEAAAKLSEASAERNKTCPSGCRCADGWHIAMRIRNLTPADAQAALDKLLARAREDAIREAAELAAAGHHPRAILALLNDGGR